MYASQNYNPWAEGIPPNDEVMICHKEWLVIIVSLHVLKMAEHSFQVPMPNLSLFLNYLCFGARFLQESRLTIDIFILAFWLECVLLPWQRGWLKTRLEKWFLFI